MAIQCYSTDWTVIRELRGVNTVGFNGNDFSGKYVNTRIIVYDGGTDFSTPVTIYPMIRDARISDDTFVPYAATNKELTELSNFNYTNLGQYGVDFNTIITPGVYSVYSSSRSTYHSPEQGWFLIYVTRLGTTNYIQQLAICTNNNGTLYVRICDDGTWKDWKMIGSYEYYDYGDAYIDLNIMTNPGMFAEYIHSASVSSLHAPINGYIMVFVSRFNISAIYQLCISQNNGIWFVRSSGDSGSTWTYWRELFGSNYPPVRGTSYSGGQDFIDIFIGNSFDGNNANCILRIYKSQKNIEFFADDGSGSWDHHWDGTLN